MRLKAIVLIPRISGVFELRNAENFIVFGGGNFRFLVERVEAAYRKENPINGYAVALIFENSQVDKDFKVLTWFPHSGHLKLINDAFDRSDELTEKLLKRGWCGKRPYRMLHHILL